MTGVDIDREAVRDARGKARARGVQAIFHDADICAPSSIRGPFDTVLDPGLFHVLSDQRRRALLSWLQPLIADSGCLYLLTVAIPCSGPGAPRPVGWPELRAMFAGGWELEWIRNEMFETSDTGPGLPALLVKVRRVCKPSALPSSSS